MKIKVPRTMNMPGKMRIVNPDLKNKTKQNTPINTTYKP